MVRPAELGGGGPRDDPGDSDQRLRGRRHRALADPAPDGAVPERAAAPWAGEPVGSRRRPAAPGAATPAHGGPRLRYKTTVQMQPGPGTSPGTGPLGSIRTYQPGTGPQVAVDDSASFWAGTGPGPAIETGPRRVSADQPTAAPDTDGRGRKRRSASAAEAQPPAGRDAAAARTGRGRTAERAARSAEPVRARSADPAQARPAEPVRAGRRSGQRRSRRMIMVAAAGVAAVVVAAGAADVLGLFGGNGPAHVLVAPDRLGAYVRRPQLEKQGNLAALQRQVIAKSAGQASHVVSGVYEDSAGSSPQMILFVGGNLSGVSASDFISSFTQQSKGSFVTSPGSLGGSAACVNAQASVPGSVALCTWADNDTFGVVASLTMNATKLAAEMRVMRPMVERIAK
jgi:hypothetical protein